jgi:circadian clock protein KaiC
MKKEHPDWNFCPTCNASLAMESRSDVLGLLLTNPENRFVISASLSTGSGTGILSPFSLNGDTKIPVWAEASQLGSPGLTKERLFEEVIVQHVLPAFRNGFKLAKYSGPEEDIHLFLQVLIKYAQKDLSDRALNLDRSLSSEPQKAIVKDLRIDGPIAPPQNDSTKVQQSLQKKSLRAHYSPEDDPNRTVLQSENQVSSGIVGLDKILGGGLPKNRITLVSGHSGTGKTVFAAQFLIDGAKKGEIGILALVGQIPTDVLEELDSLGLPILSLVRQHKIFLIVCDERRMFQTRGADIINVRGRSQLLSAVKKLVAKKRASRAVIDSFTALINSSDSRHTRSSIAEMFEKLADVKCTTLLTGELQPGSQGASYYGIEEMLASGVIVLGSKNIADHYTRYLYVPKMKGANHSLSEYVFSIEDGVGIKVLQSLKAYSELLLPRVPMPQQGSMSLADLSGLLKILANLNPNLMQAQSVYAGEGREAGMRPESGSYVWQTARSYLSNANTQDRKVLHIRPNTVANRPRQLSMDDAKLTSAASENPWVSIISSREEEDAEKATEASSSETKTLATENSMSNQQDSLKPRENGNPTMK